MPLHSLVVVVVVRGQKVIQYLLSELAATNTTPIPPEEGFQDSRPPCTTRRAVRVTDSCMPHL